MVLVEALCAANLAGSLMMNGVCCYQKMKEMKISKRRMRESLYSERIEDEDLEVDWTKLKQYPMTKSKSSLSKHLEASEHGATTRIEGQHSPSSSPDWSCPPDSDRNFEHPPDCDRETAPSPAACSEESDEVFSAPRGAFIKRNNEPIVFVDRPSITCKQLLEIKSSSLFDDLCDDEDDFEEMQTE